MYQTILTHNKAFHTICQLLSSLPITKEGIYIRIHQICQNRSTLGLVLITTVLIFTIYWLYFFLLGIQITLYSQVCLFSINIYFSYNFRNEKLRENKHSIYISFYGRHIISIEYFYLK